MGIEDRIEALGEYGDNSLDVEVELALFKPNSVFIAARSNNAGTKIIYRDVAGNDVTCWADDWTIAKRRKSTLAALRARTGDTDEG